ncbi:MAG: DNA polymerase II [Spirochaetales bacterium]|nr:DNA polymerase II [Spirochaetales bacterium]
MSGTGFIIDIYHHQSKPILYILGRMENQETFAIIENREKPHFYIRRSERELAAGTGMKHQLMECSCRTMDGESVLRLECNTMRDLRRSKEILERERVRTYEGDVKFADQFLLSRSIDRSIEISGVYKKGRRVDRIYINPAMKSASRIPQLKVLALDIETSLETHHIRALSLAGEGFKRVLLVPHDPIETNQPDIQENFKTEKELLERFAFLVNEFDPDILTGWNVIDFDFLMIARRFADLGLVMDFGRSDKSCVFLESKQGRKHQLIIPGRQVIDSMWLIRASREKYKDYTLETVSQTLLGEGKEISLKGDEKVELLEKLYREDPHEYALYCLKDSELVIRILKKTNLMNLTIMRSLLTGINLERAWTSIMPFEHLYMKFLHQRSIVAPSLGTDSHTTFGAPGGYILSPESALYENVYIFDFKSLYPSIIRTFNIDPLSFVFVDSDPGKNENSVNYIKAPNNACFLREPGILPEIISGFFEKREQAKRDGDPTASYVYKILMNSFYGVLGTPGCRFASSLFAGAITGFGQKLLIWCRDYLREKGFRVIYGDTDSLFVESVYPPGTDYHVLLQHGERLTADVNSAVGDYVKQEYNVVPRLELEFEKIYSKLFIPPMRLPGRPLVQADKDDKARGRAKGYAGFTMTAHSNPDISTLIEIKGMEAIRSDWTDLAHEFQIHLLSLVFTHAKEEEIICYIKKICSELREGKYDDKLIYRKQLRRSVISYTKNKPPQVKAAEKLGWKNRRGRIEYVITQNGPEPVAKQLSPLDYDHYIDKQLKPIALSFHQILTFDPELLFDGLDQPLLF